MEQNPKKHIDSYLALANGLRFKLWAIVGKNESKKQNIINYLTNTLKWSVIDVESQLSGMYKELDQLEEPSSEVGLKLKEWFNSLPNNIILTNASILYHSSFTKISPVGAFKYNSRNKNCVIFLENEELLGNRLYYGEAGAEDYYDREINDIVITKFDQILEDYTPSVLNEGAGNYQVKITNKDAIGNLFDFHEIKDVIDIDTDIKENDLQQELVSSYIISESLEQQIVDFYDNLKTPKHRAVKILGNYGSGKSHLIAFLVSTVLRPELRELISNTKVKEASKDVTRKYLSVQFELQSQHLDLSYIFFRRLESQLKSSYNIDIPKYNKEIVDFKEHLTSIIETVKSTDPTLGLLVVIDEVSDFLDTKPQHEMKRDFQFLRAIAQVCQSQDFLLVTSMQEDVYSSARFKDIAAQAGRIDQRFQNITIHRETIHQVISQRIVPKSANQKANIELKLKPYAEKIEDVSSKMDRYTELLPFTPFLLNLFDDLPYFEKRGVIQFAQSEVKHKLNEPFPHFFTFDKIFDVMENNPNIKNMETIYETVKVVNIIKQRISANLEEKLHKDAYIKPQLRNILSWVMVEEIFDPFRLVGGTALSLQLGHRESIDIDLFTETSYGEINFDAIDRHLKKDNFEYVDSPDVPVAMGKSYFVGNSAEDCIKLDLFYTDPFIQPALKIDNIRLATLAEITAMKIDVVSRGARKKDFWDFQNVVLSFVQHGLFEC